VKTQAWENWLAYVKFRNQEINYDIENRVRAKGRRNEGYARGDW